MNIPPGFAQVNFVLGGTALPRGAQITIGVDNQTDDFGADGVAFHASDNWNFAITPVWTELGTLEKVHAKLGPNATGPEADNTTPYDGADDYQPTPAQAALLVTKNTALGGRQGRGRLFMPSINEAGVTAAGVVQTATVLVWQNAFNAFFDAMAGNNLPLVLLHNAVEVVPTPVTSLTVNSLMATQRRRIRRVGGRKKKPPA